MKWSLTIFILLVSNIYFISCSDETKNKVVEPYPEELSAKIDRGLVCFQKKDKENFLSWRLLPQDPNTPKYFIWRKNVSSNAPIVELIGTTSRNYFLDQNLQNGKKYLYSVSLTDSVPNQFQEVVTKANNDSTDFEALTFDIGEDYKQVRVATGDLNGDGEPEILTLYSKMQDVDPFAKAWMKSTDTYKIIVFQRNGQRLWTKDLGWGIEAGNVYAPVVIWDLDADGKCEVILKTNKSKNPRDYNSEFLTILNGENGNIIKETRWPDPQSDDYNSNSRNYIAIAHLDGHNPSIIVGRGTYFKQVLCAYDVNLNKLWERFFGTDIQPKFNNQYLRKIWSWFSDDQSRASHSLPIVDIDGNGTEEIFWGEHCITENGDDLWEVKDRIPYYGHPDIVYSADIIPQLPGLETFYCREGWRNKHKEIGFLLVDKSGNTIWGKWGLTHVDGGWADRVVDSLDGIQLFAFDVGSKNWKPGSYTYTKPYQFLVGSKGETLFEPDSSWIHGFTVDWEGDGVKEIVTNQGSIERYNGDVLKTFGNELKWGGDLFGDNREELVYTPFDGKVYIIFNTQEMDAPSQITRLADRRYRNDLSRTSMHINVIPTVSGYIPQKQVVKSKVKQ